MIKHYFEVRDDEVVKCTEEGEGISKTCKTEVVMNKEIFSGMLQKVD